MSGNGGSPSDDEMLGYPTRREFLASLARKAAIVGGALAVGGAAACAEVVAQVGPPVRTAGVPLIATSTVPAQLETRPPGAVLTTASVTSGAPQRPDPVERLGGKPQRPAIQK